MKYFLLFIFFTIHPALSASNNTAATPTHQSFLETSDNHKSTPPKWLKPYSAHYRITRHGKKKGQATRELSHLQNLWTLSSYSKVSIFLFSDKRTEVTTFRWENFQLKTLSYNYLIKNSFSKKNTEENFDWEQKIIQGHRDKDLHWKIALEDEVYNPLSYQLVIRQQLIKLQKKNQGILVFPQKLSIKVSGKGAIKIRQILVEKFEDIVTPAGTFTAAKLIKTSGSRTTIFWMAKKLDYIPVKIYQQKKGKEQATMVLSDIKFNIKK